MEVKTPSWSADELWKPGVIGQDLFSALWALVNESKSKNYIPLFMRLANITSIYKLKGSKKCLENDHSIFVLTVIRGILDRLLYNDMSPEVEKNMSNS